MRDDLVKRLRYLGDHASFEPHMHHTAADRIKELEAKLKWVLEERDATFALMLKRAETAEAKLTKAVAALDEAVYLLAPTEKDMERQAGIYRIVTTIVELKGQGDE